MNMQTPGQLCHVIFFLHISRVLSSNNTTDYTSNKITYRVITNTSQVNNTELITNTSLVNNTELITNTSKQYTKIDTENTPQDLFNETTADEKAMLKEIEEIYDGDQVDPEFAAIGMSYHDAEKLVKVAKITNAKINETLRRQYERRPKYEAYYKQQDLSINISMNLMKQSLYATKMRLEGTRPMRKKHSQEIAYNFAVLYGSLMQLRIKLDNMFATMRNLKDVKFLFYLILYERILMTTIDVDSIVARMFEQRNQLNQMLLQKQREEFERLKTTQNVFEQRVFQQEKERVKGRGKGKRKQKRGKPRG